MSNLLPGLVELAAKYRFRLQGADVDTLQATNIHGPLIRIRTWAVKWVHAANWAEIVSRNVLVELVNA
jgi:hypothetical protein